MQLRYFAALQDIAGERSSTVVFPLPMDLLGHWWLGQCAHGVVASFLGGGHDDDCRQDALIAVARLDHPLKPRPGWPFPLCHQSGLGRVCGSWMMFVKEYCEAIPDGIVVRHRSLKQRFLYISRQVRPELEGGPAQ